MRPESINSHVHGTLLSQGIKIGLVPFFDHDGHGARSRKRKQFSLSGVQSVLGTNSNEGCVCLATLQPQQDVSHPRSNSVGCMGSIAHALNDDVRSLLLLSPLPLHMTLLLSVEVLIPYAFKPLVCW